MRGVPRWDVREGRWSSRTELPGGELCYTAGCWRLGLSRLGRRLGSCFPMQAKMVSIVQTINRGGALFRHHQLEHSVPRIGWVFVLSNLS